MTERNIDPTRQGGTGNAAPKAVIAAPEMSADEALAYTADLEQRTVLAPSHQATLALRREVERIRGELEKLWGINRSLRSALHAADTEVFELRAEAERAVRTIAGACEESDELRREVKRLVEQVTLAGVYSQHADAECERLRAELDTRATEEETRELLDEVERLRGVNATLARDALAADGQAHEAYGELERIRAAAPEIIRCSNAAGCRDRDYAWAGCCMVRAAFVRLGLLPSDERLNGEDGA